MTPVNPKVKAGGAGGAVSDSRTGGDGVYRKRRGRHLVDDYLTTR